MYKSIRGIYKNGKIVPIEKVKLQKDEINVIITFIFDDIPPKKNRKRKKNSDVRNLLYSMGDRAGRGKHNDGSVNHDLYLYGKKK